MTPEIYNRLVAGLLNNYKQLCDAWEQFPEEQRLSLKGPPEVVRLLLSRCRGKVNQQLHFPVKPPQPSR